MPADLTWRCTMSQHVLTEGQAAPTFEALDTMSHEQYTAAANDTSCIAVAFVPARLKFNLPLKPLATINKAAIA